MRVRKFNGGREVVKALVVVVEHSALAAVDDMGKMVEEMPLFLSPKKCNFPSHWGIGTMTWWIVTVIVLMKGRSGVALR